MAGVNRMNEKEVRESTRIDTGKEIRLEGTTICPGVGIGRVRASDQRRIYKKAG
jgi:orotidine-5'-phosphate decarboxylase